MEYSYQQNVFICNLTKKKIVQFALYVQPLYQLMITTRKNYFSINFLYSGFNWNFFESNSDLINALIIKLAVITTYLSMYSYHSWGPQSPWEQIYRKAVDLRNEKCKQIINFNCISQCRLTFDVVEDVAGDIILLRQQVEHVRRINVALLLKSRIALLLIVF